MELANHIKTLHLVLLLVAAVASASGHVEHNSVNGDGNDGIEVFPV